MVVEAGSESFVLTDGTKRVEVPWSAVAIATVLKFDQFVVDEIGMLVLCDEPFGLVQMSEQTPGFREFSERVQTALPGSVPWAEWYLTVAFPAFETTARCIYRRGGTPDPAPLQPVVPHTTEPTKDSRFRRWVRILTGF